MIAGLEARVIPDFNENGYLPPGVYTATMDEVLRRFGRGSDDRVACGQSLQWLVPMCRRAGIVRLILNGSFVTDRADPGDVDCLLVAGPAFHSDSDAAFALEVGLPYLSMTVAARDEDEDVVFYRDLLFASDRNGLPKGLLEVVL